jgi:hypothetical protein
VWQVGYSESFGAASATAASPVAVSAGTVYRAADDPSSGFVVRKKFVDTTFAQPWETVWDAQNGTAEATSMDVWGLSLGDFAMGTLLAVGYRTTATDPPFPLGRFAIVVDESGGARSWSIRGNSSSVVRRASAPTIIRWLWGYLAGPRWSW